MSALQRIALLFTIIGDHRDLHVRSRRQRQMCIRDSLIGFFQFDLVAAIFGGQNSMISRIIYGIVGIAGLINLALLFKPAEELGRTEPKVSRT